MNLIKIVETGVEDVIHDAEGVAKEVGTTIKVAWLDAEGKVVAVAKTDEAALVGDVSSGLKKLLPAEYTVLKAFITRAIADVGSGDFADIETAVLNLAEQAGAVFVADLGSPTLTAFIAIVKSL